MRVKISQKKAGLLTPVGRKKFLLRTKESDFSVKLIFISFCAPESQIVKYIMSKFGMSLLKLSLVMDNSGGFSG